MEFNIARYLILSLSLVPTAYGSDGKAETEDNDLVPLRSSRSGAGSADIDSIPKGPAHTRVQGYCVP